MPAPVNGGQSPLEIAAISARNCLIPQNTYNCITSNEYTVTHTRALADQTTPNYGKGTGDDLQAAIINYNGGSDLDINGNPNVAQGSGRKPAFALNLGTWGFDPNHCYKQPDMTKNCGQVIVY